MTRHFRKLSGYLDAREIRDALRKDAAWFERANAAGVETQGFVLQIVRPSEKERYVGCVPLYSLKAAAGAFSGEQAIEETNCDWVGIDTGRQLRPGMFVAQVVGKSMEPKIPDGSYCLFSTPVTGTRQGRTLLVQLHDFTDRETGGRYTVKQYQSEKVSAADGTWRHLKVSLKPINPAFKPLELTAESEDEVRVIAEVIEVLG